MLFEPIQPPTTTCIWMGTWWWRSSDMFLFGSSSARCVALVFYLLSIYTLDPPLPGLLRYSWAAGLPSQFALVYIIAAVRDTLDDIFVSNRTLNFVCSETDKSLFLLSCYPETCDSSGWMWPSCCTDTKHRTPVNDDNTSSWSTFGSVCIPHSFTFISSIDVSQSLKKVYMW
jgi:hypothetical protein